MSNAVLSPSTEAEWLRAIMKASKCSEIDVRAVLLKYGIKAQTTPPRAKDFRFRSIHISGVRAESERDGPFDVLWGELDAGLWAVMSDGNFKGKSSILNLMHAAIRGEFPGRLKADVWKWLEHIEVIFSIDGVTHKTEIRKNSGEENPAKSHATLSRTENNSDWITLYGGDGGEGLKAQTEQLMMDELNFPVIYAHNSKTGGTPHGWPSISSALFLTSSSEAKALFGEVKMDGLPLRLLQLFIGLPWVSTYSSALTAQKKLQEGKKEQAESTSLNSVLSQKLEETEKKLESAKAAIAGTESREIKRLRLSEIDTAALEARKSADIARVSLEEVEASHLRISDSFDEARRQLKQLEDEQAAGYSFRKLSPTCCPACEGTFARNQTSNDAGDHKNCSLCKNEVPTSDQDIDGERIQLAHEAVDELRKALKIAKDKQKEAKKLSNQKIEQNIKLQKTVQMLLNEIGQDTPEPEIEILQLEAQASQLREMINGSNRSELAPKGTDHELAILEATTIASKHLMTRVQVDVLEEISSTVKVLATKFGLSNVTEMHLDNGGKLKVRQGGADTYFTHLTPGERLRIKIAISLAAVKVAKNRGHGRHPGLLIIDSPASEEVVEDDFEQMLDSVSTALKDIDGVQIIIGTIARPAVLAVIPRNRQLRAEGDDYLF